MLSERVGFHRTPEAVYSCPLPAPLQTVRKSRASNRSPKSLAKDRSKPPLAVSGIAVEVIFYYRTSLPQSLDNILFLFRGQKTARFENDRQSAVTLEKS